MASVTGELSTTRAPSSIVTLGETMTPTVPWLPMRAPPPATTAPAPPFSMDTSPFAMTGPQPPLRMVRLPLAMTGPQPPFRIEKLPPTNAKPACDSVRCTSRALTRPTSDFETWASDSNSTEAKMLRPCSSIAALLSA